MAEDGKTAKIGFRRHLSLYTFAYRLFFPRIFQYDAVNLCNLKRA